jgi:hypothetical protein
MKRSILVFTILTGILGGLLGGCSTYKYGKSYADSQGCSTINQHRHFLNFNK